MNRAPLVAIASNTLREVIRQRLFVNLAVFGAALLLLAVVVSNITYGFPDRVVRSIGLGATSVVTNMLSLLVGISLIHQEIDRKSLFVILTRPVGRGTYVHGRFLGLVAVVWAALLGFALLFLLSLVMVGGHVQPSDALALFMVGVEATVLGAFALLLSSFSTPMVAAGIGLGFWIACASVDDLVSLTRGDDMLPQLLATVLAWVLPNFARFNFREAAVYQDPASFGLVAWTLGYALLFIIALQLATIAVMRRREMI